ncbi:unnamed protein product [Rhizoctonia solani]|uniref:Uncharacterized protein n=3 Tax=Rhizoctonia solani TaxID=456999 RepID=A0A8H2WK14_9AGAM|nr:hypothetical protein RSOL_166420 [Rhizoctonia solani AG-3 Rhs1AP]KEP49014.1 hypothetical protein V565_110100 [Rhizoctonia solani 123E]CAE6390363.1 unnamed protein product [Rhizoctonia solani]
MSSLQISGHPSSQPPNANWERANAVYGNPGRHRQPKDVIRPRLRVVTSSPRYPQLPTPPLNDFESAGSSPWSYTVQTSKAPQSQKTLPKTFSRSYLPSPPPSDIGSTKSSPITELPSSTWRKSVRFNDSEVRIGPGQYSPYSPRSPSKAVLKIRELKAADMPSLFAVNTPIVAASSAMDTVLISLTACLRNFKWPSELDFSVNTGSPLILANTEKNKAFIHQFHNLDRLWDELNKIPTHGDKKLEGKHKATGTTIGKALQRMKEHQLRLYKKFTDAVESALDNITTDFDAWVKYFEYLCELDSHKNSEDNIYSLINERSKSFIDLLRKLHWFQEALNNIPAHGDERLQNQRRAIAMEIERALQRMQEHRAEFHSRRHIKAHRPRRITEACYR